MAKNEIFSYSLFCFEMEIVGYAEIRSVYKWCVFFIDFTHVEFISTRAKENELWRPNVSS